MINKHNFINVTIYLNNRLAYINIKIYYTSYMTHILVSLYREMIQLLNKLKIM